MNIFLDVIHPDGSFICQIKYDGEAKKTLFPCGVLPSYDKRELRAYIIKKRPTLRNVDFTFELTNKRL